MIVYRWRLSILEGLVSYTHRGQNFSIVNTGTRNQYFKQKCYYLRYSWKFTFQANPNRPSGLSARLVTATADSLPRKLLHALDFILRSLASSYILQGDRFSPAQPRCNQIWLRSLTRFVTYGHHRSSLLHHIPMFFQPTFFLKLNSLEPDGSSSISWKWDA